MKRRVLRAHNNKKALRHLQAVHGLREPHTVLCDSSFLRSVAQHHCDNLFSLIAEVVGRCSVQVLPETMSVLQRQSSTSSSASSSAAVSNNPNPKKDATASLKKAAPLAGVTPSNNNNNKAGGVNNKNKKNVKLDKKAAVMESSAKAACSLASRFVIPSPFQATQQQGQAKNEQKAIAEYVSDPTYNRGVFVFVATQSHDLRRMLPKNLAVLRATFQPLAVWLEEAGEPQAQTGGGEGVVGMNQKKNDVRGTSSSSMRTTKKGTPSTAKAVPTVAAPGLSPADVAFMKQLGVQLPNTGKKNRRPHPKQKSKPSVSTAPTSSPAGGVDQSPGAGTVEKSAKKSTGESVKFRKKNKVKGVNPLAMKKKQTKEVFVVK